METKFQSMFDNYTNGNLKDFRKGLANLDKAGLLAFVCWGLDNELISPYEILTQWSLR